MKYLRIWKAALTESGWCATEFDASDDCIALSLTCEWLNAVDCVGGACREGDAWPMVDGR